MNDEEIKQLAIDIRSRKVFGTWSLKNGEDAETVFMPLIFMEGDARESYLSDCGHLYEYLDKCGPMTVNGLPTFFSMRKLTTEDLPRIWSMVQRLESAEASVVA